MKVWLDNNYDITATDGPNSFTKGNNNYDTLYVYIPTENIAKDNTLPTFNFQLANGRKYGPFTHTNNAAFEDDFTVFSFQLTDKLLSVEGKIFITIMINYFNSSNSIYKSRNINIQGNVVDAIVMDNGVIIIGNEEAILDSLQQKVDALNNRLTDVEVATIQEVGADVDSSVGVPSVDVELGGTPRERTFTLHFRGLKGETGPQGEQGLQGPQGIQGKRGAPFEIAKTYKSIEEMELGYATDNLELGKLVAIVSNTEDVDNAKIYVKGETEYEFLIDLSGAKGIQGEQGVGIESIIMNEDYTLSIQLTNGNIFRTESIQGPQGEQGLQGPAGEPGTEIFVGGVKQSSFNADFKTINNQPILGSGNINISVPNFYEYVFICNGTDGPNGNFTFSILTSSPNSFNVGSFSGNIEANGNYNKLNNVEKQLYDFLKNNDYNSTAYLYPIHGKVWCTDSNTYEIAYGLFVGNNGVFNIIMSYDSGDYTSKTWAVEFISVKRRKI